MEQAQSPIHDPLTAGPLAGDWTLLRRVIWSVAAWLPLFFATRETLDFAEAQ
jgi:hypothetical protein